MIYVRMEQQTTTDDRWLPGGDMLWTGYCRDARVAGHIEGIDAQRRGIGYVLAIDARETGTPVAEEPDQ